MVPVTLKEPMPETAEKKKVNWREVHKEEIVEFVRNFYRSSWNWRSQAYHPKWDKWENNYRNIYDKDILAKKEPWQATMFVPETVKNVEVIASSLTKISSGKKRSIAYEPRESGDEHQAELNTDLLDYYREKGDYDLNRYQCVKESCIYGSGFMKIYWEKKVAKRRVVKPVMEGFLEALPQGRLPKKKGESKEFQEIVVKDGITYKYVHIRDIFPEPNFTDLSRLIHRDKLTYNEIKRMGDAGLFDKESVDALEPLTESDNFEVDLQSSKYEQGLTDPKLPRPTWDKKHTVWEFNGMLPLKWINLDMPEDTPEQIAKASEVTPGVALVASAGYYLSSGESNAYDEEPSFVKMDYIPTPGGGYGIGVAQLIEGLQDEYNEIRNQRIDNVNMLMNRMILVLERYVVDPKELRSKPFGVIRLKGAITDVNDVKKVMQQLEVSDVPISAFRETGELERQIQETTAANRVTTGGAGMTRDTNQTLGGMELLKQAAYDRFVVYAYIQGKAFDVKVAKKSSELIYLNITDQAVERILGMVPVEMFPGQYLPRWETWKRLDPQDLNVCYDLIPVDVFGQENKFQKSQDLASKGQLIASLIPGWDPKPLIKKLLSYSELGSDEISEVIASLDAMPGPIPTPMGMGEGIPSVSRPTKQTASETPPVSPLDAGGAGAMNVVG